MIQRIQSIFLLLAAACAFGLFALPFASTGMDVESSYMFADAEYTITDNLALLVLFGAAGALALADIFLFKNRKTQMLVGRFAIIANLIGLVAAIILFYNESANITVDEIDDGLGLYLPILFLVFALLALRYISKDDKLVRSMDRLR